MKHTALHNTRISLIVLILDLLTFQCAVLIHDTSRIAVSFNGLVHIYIWMYCPNQVSFFIITFYCYTYNIEQFNTVQFELNCFDF